MMTLLYNFFDKLKSILSTEWGWLLTVLTSAAVSTQNLKLGVYIVAGAVLGDMIWGVAASCIQKKFLVSTFFRETFKKIAIYFFALIGTFILEAFVKTDFLAFKTFVVLITVCELWSTSASMLIVKPNMPFLKIIRGQLKGEIQAKLSKNINLDDILKDDTTNNTPTT